MKNEIEEYLGGLGRGSISHWVKGQCTSKHLLLTLPSLGLRSSGAQGSLFLMKVQSPLFSLYTSPQAEQALAVPPTWAGGGWGSEKVLRRNGTWVWFFCSFATATPGSLLWAWGPQHQREPKLIFPVEADGRVVESRTQVGVGGPGSWTLVLS